MYKTRIITYFIIARYFNVSPSKYILETRCISTNAVSIVDEIARSSVVKLFNYCVIAILMASAPEVQIRILKQEEVASD